MIPEGAWSFLRVLPQTEEANAVASELARLMRKGDEYLQMSYRVVGALVITTVAMAAAVYGQHVWLARTGLVVTVVLWVVRSHYNDRFRKNFRRIAFLDGFAAAKCGRPPDGYR